VPDLKMTAAMAASDLRAEASRQADRLKAYADDLGETLMKIASFDEERFDASKSDAAVFVDFEVRGNYSQIQLMAGGQWLGSIDLIASLKTGKYRALLLMNRIES
jgi:hypothetical protein